MMTLLSSTRRHARARPGFTLPELLVATVLLAIIGASLISVLSKQQRFYRGTGDLIELRSQLRQASAAITADLRGVSTVGGDILSMTDSSIDFRQTFGTSIICKIPTPGGSQIVIPPTSLSSGVTLTQWLAGPASGDGIFVFDENTTTALSDDRWQDFTINAAPTVAPNSCPTGSGNFTSTDDNTKNSYTIALSGTLNATVTVGAPVRFYHVAHYSLYKASDNNWYLGFCSPACSASNPITAVAGPFRPYSTTSANSGLVLTYFDKTGAVTTTKASVARIGVVIRGATRNPVTIGGLKPATYYDSLVTTVAVRNRS